MPGEYEAIRNGKDNHGRQLGAGESAVCIEAAREHGTSPLIRGSVKPAKEPLVEEPKGNVEIKPAAIAYRPQEPVR